MKMFKYPKARFRTVNARLYFDPKAEARPRSVQKGGRRWTYNPSAKYKAMVKNLLKLAVANKKDFKRKCRVSLVYSNKFK